MINFTDQWPEWREKNEIFYISVLKYHYPKFNFHFDVSIFIILGISLLVYHADVGLRLHTQKRRRDLLKTKCYVQTVEMVRCVQIFSLRRACCQQE